MNRTKFFAFLRWGGLALLVSLVLMQFAQPTRTNPPVPPGRDLLGTGNAPDAKVAALLRAACYDCHSHETKWPWYGYTAPVSWWLAEHIKDGRRHLNFSDWPPADPRRARKKLSQIAETVTEGEMPLASYTWAHPEARLSAADKKLIADWAEAEAAKIPGGAEHAGDEK